MEEGHSLPTAGPSKFSQRGLSQLERHHQPKEMLNIFFAIFLNFPYLSIVIRRHGEGLLADALGV